MLLLKEQHLFVLDGHLYSLSQQLISQQTGTDCRTSVSPSQLWHVLLVNHLLKIDGTDDVTYLQLVTDRRKNFKNALKKCPKIFERIRSSGKR